jgi:hypothetical protein
MFPNIPSVLIVFEDHLFPFVLKGWGRCLELFVCLRVCLGLSILYELGSAIVTNLQQANALHVDENARLANEHQSETFARVLENAGLVIDGLVIENARLANELQQANALHVDENARLAHELQQANALHVEGLVIDGLVIDGLVIENARLANELQQANALHVEGLAGLVIENARLANELHQANALHVVEIELLQRLFDEKCDQSRRNEVIVTNAKELLVLTVVYLVLELSYVGFATNSVMQGHFAAFAAWCDPTTVIPLLFAIVTIAMVISLHSLLGLTCNRSVARLLFARLVARLFIALHPLLVLTCNRFHWCRIHW